MNLGNAAQSSLNGTSDSYAVQPTIRSAATPHVLSVLASLTVMSLIADTTFVLYTLFAFTPITSGGLGLSEAQIGLLTDVRSTDCDPYLGENTNHLRKVRETVRDRIVIEREYAAKLQALAKRATEKQSRRKAMLVVGDNPTKSWDENTLRRRSVRI